MNEEKFVERREDDWKRLVHLCDKADASTAFLTAADFHDLINVYLAGQQRPCPCPDSGRQYPTHPILERHCVASLRADPSAQAQAVLDRDLPTGSFSWRKRDAVSSGLSG